MTFPDDAGRDGPPRPNTSDPYVGDYHVRMTVSPRDDVIRRLADDARPRTKAGAEPGAATPEQIATELFAKVAPKVYETMHLVVRMAIEYEFAADELEQEAVLDSHAEMIKAGVGRDRDGPSIRNPIYCKKDGKCYCVHGATYASSNSSRSKTVITSVETAMNHPVPCPTGMSSWPDCEEDFVDSQGNVIDLIDVTEPFSGIPKKRECEGCKGKRGGKGSKESGKPSGKKGKKKKGDS